MNAGHYIYQGTIWQLCRLKGEVTLKRCSLWSVCKYGWRKEIFGKVAVVPISKRGWFAGMLTSRPAGCGGLCCSEENHSEGWVMAAAGRFPGRMEVLCDHNNLKEPESSRDVSQSTHLSSQHKTYSKEVARIWREHSPPPLTGSC